MQTPKRAGILAVAVVAFLWAWPADAQLAETPASAWMELERSHRTAYVIGFLSGVQHTLQRIGMDLRIREGVTADETPCVNPPGIEAPGAAGRLGAA
jgi:hypothetical protein